MAELKIVKDPENAISVEVLEAAIIDVSNAARKLLGSRLTSRAILVLIRDSMTNPPPLKTIQNVLESAADLEKRYIKPQSKK